MRFFAIDLGLRIISQLAPLVQTIRQHDRKLAGQIVDAANSINPNLGEGNRRRGRDRIYLWRVASGSADAVQLHLLDAVAWGHLDKKRIKKVRDDIDHLLAILWKLTNG